MIRAAGITEYCCAWTRIRRSERLRADRTVGGTIGLSRADRTANGWIARPKNGSGGKGWTTANRYTGSGMVICTKKSWFDAEFNPDRIAG